jgi:hypothetical protein
MYWLTNADSQDLVGVQWFGESDFPLIATEGFYKPKHTVALRLYNGYLQQGLANPFMASAHRHYVGSLLETSSEFSGFWLQTDRANTAARRTYTSFGYEELADLDGRVTAFLSPQKALEMHQGI